MPDLVEGEIFVPPPPSMAPPPPPGSFILPPPNFMGDLNSPGLKNLQSPSMPTPNPTSLSSMGEEDFTFLKPPPMAPPKPPSTCSSGSTSSLPISSPPVPEHPKFAPPQPPSERQQKTYKTPPPKPMRLSSISILDSPPETPAPPPPVQTPTLSSFNPQNTAKLYNISNTSLLSRFEDCNTKPKQMLLLEDSGSVKSAPVLVQVDGKASKMATPSKPVSKGVQELKDNLHITQRSPSPLPDPNKEAKTGTVSAPLETDKPLRTLHQTSLLLQKVNSTSVNSESSKDKFGVSPSQSQKFSPLLDRKLRNLKSSETNAAREGTVASPLALLMAAKEREKHRSSQILSQENGFTKNEQPSASIRPSDSNPNSFIVTPKSSSSSSLTFQSISQVTPKSASSVKHTQTIQTPQKPSSPAAVKDQMQSTSLNRMAESLSATNLVTQKQNSEKSPPKSQHTQHGDDKEELNMPLLPPPPEFDDLDGTMGPPPSIPPPDPPMKKAPTQNVSCLSPAQYPSPPPKPKAPEAPKPLHPDTYVKPKPQVQTKPMVSTSQLPTVLSPSQATLLSILQKKMLEMDQKMAPVKEAESSSDDWGTPLSDENNKGPLVSRVTPKSKNGPLVNKAATLDMRELESKVLKNCQETSSIKVPTR